MGDNKYLENEKIEELKVKVEEVRPIPLSIGIVSRCIKLNVRKQPSIDSEIIFELRKGTKVNIYQIINDSLNKWCYITADVAIDNEVGRTIEGYVISDFIEVGE